MPEWSVRSEVVSVVAFAVVVIVIFSQVFRSSPNTGVACCGVLLAIAAMIGFSDANARPGR